MNFQEIKGYIVTIIREEFNYRNLDVKQIVLFGSQSRGDAGFDSDWDFLVCTSTELEFGKKAKLTTAIQRRLAPQHILVDVIIKSEERIKQERNNVGVITYYALKDGVLV